MTIEPLSPADTSAKIPAPLSYVGQPKRMAGPPSGPVEPPAGSPAWDFNRLDDFLELALVPFLARVRDALGVRIWDEAQSAWVQVPVYMSADDPATLSVPPAEPYVWIQLAASGGTVIL